MAAKGFELQEALPPVKLRREARQEFRISLHTLTRTYSVGFFMPFLSKQGLKAVPFLHDPESRDSIFSNYGFSRGHGLE